jgi:hypothetical protein
MGPESNRGMNLKPPQEDRNSGYFDSCPDNDVVEAPQRSSAVMRKAARVVPDGRPDVFAERPPALVDTMEKVNQLMALLEAAKQYELVKEQGVDYDTVADIDVELDGLSSLAMSTVNDGSLDVEDVRQQVAIFEGVCHVLGRKTGMLIREEPEDGYGWKAKQKNNKKGQA